MPTDEMSTNQHAVRRTAGLTATLAALSCALTALAPAGPLLRPAVDLGPAVLAGLLAALAFGVTELADVHVEFRQEAYTFVLTGLPLVVALLLLDARIVVAARVVGALILVVVRRPPPLKAAYNTASSGFEAALAAVAVHVLLQPVTELDVRTAAGVWGVVLVADLVVNALILLVITWHSGPVTPAGHLRVHVPAALLTSTTAVLAFSVVLLLSTGPVGLLVVAVATPGLLVANQAYSVLQRRHQSLALVQDFVAEGRGAADGHALAARLLARLREVLHASWVELRLDAQESGPAQVLCVRVGEDGVPQEGSHPRVEGDWVLARALADRRPVLVPRRPRDPALLRWLEATGVRDAMVIPLLDGDVVLGTLVVADRLGEARTFSAADLAVAQTLATHTTVAVRNALLMQQLRHDANHDALTGLANRAMLEGRLTSTRAAARRDPPGGSGLSRVAVLLLDLNRFKDVNDALGHHAGDRLLLAVARRLVGLAPASALVARLGGDEFAILLPSVASTQEATAVASAAAAALRVPVALGETTVTADASIGVAMSCPDRSDVADLLRRADLAMYAAKKTGQPWVLYSAELDRGHAERLALVTDLQVALSRGEISVVFQPKLDLSDRRIRGVEALARWHHPEHGPIPPDVFIPLAESTGLIDELLRTVLSHALQQVSRWREQGYDLSVAVNLSARNLNDVTLPTTVVQALTATGLPPRSLVLEITESSVMGDPGATLPVLRTLAGLGVRLSLDDFGTGYSSLSYLQSLPVSEVKIDRSFVSGMSGDVQSPAAGPPPAAGPGPAPAKGDRTAQSEGDRTALPQGERPQLPPGERAELPLGERAELLVRAITDLARGLGLDVVAEGVEDAGTLRRLEEIGCHVVQGYLVSRPLPAADLSPVLAQRAERLHEPPARLRVVAG